MESKPRSSAQTKRRVKETSELESSLDTDEYRIALTIVDWADHGSLETLLNQAGKRARAEKYVELINDKRDADRQISFAAVAKLATECYYEEGRGSFSKKGYEKLLEKAMHAVYSTPEEKAKFLRRERKSKARTTADD